MTYSILSIYLEDVEIYHKKINWSPNQIWVLNEQDQAVVGLESNLWELISQSIFTIHNAKQMHITIDEDEKNILLKEILNTKNKDIFSIMEDIGNKIYRVIEEYFETKEAVKDS